MSKRVDLCGKIYAYLPVLIREDTQRPDWCPGFEAKEIETVNLKLETGETQHEDNGQQELPL
jgi:hypothetical protein